MGFTTLRLSLRIETLPLKADVAQLVEQSIRNRQVIGSSPIVGSIFFSLRGKPFREPSRARRNPVEMMLRQIPTPIYTRCRSFLCLFCFRTRSPLRKLIVWLDLPGKTSRGSGTKKNSTRTRIIGFFIGTSLKGSRTITIKQNGLGKAPQPCHRAPNQVASPRLQVQDWVSLLHRLAKASHSCTPPTSKAQAAAM